MNETSTELNIPSTKTCLILMGLLLSLIGCGGGGGSDNAPPNPPPNTTSPLGLSDRPSNTACIAPDSPNSAPNAVELFSAFPNLPNFNFAIVIKQLPNDDGWFYVAERGGVIKRFANNASAATASTVLDISTKIDFFNSEGGLLGFAFHPDVANNLKVYVSYTTGTDKGNGPDRSVVSRFTLSSDLTTIDVSSERVLLELNQPAGNHNGGDIAFGPDGFLYIAFGDGGANRNSAQDTSNFFGAMLRIDVDADTANAPFYSVPNTNPFFGDTTKAQEIYAYGFRNPWRWSFDQQTGDMWVADVGQNTYEEINRVSLGGNYGWPIMEGMHCFMSGCDMTGLVLPEYEYTHTGGNCSITGGFVYRGDDVAGLNGRYLFSDYCSGEINSLDGSAASKLTDTFTNVVGFGQSNAGEVYVLRGGNSGILGVRASGGSTGASNIATQLSATGCVDADNPAQPNTGVVPYDVITPLWSDGAAKTRFFAVPDNTTIELEDDGDFSFPVGSVLVKHFANNNTLIETRLYMHHQNGWAGYSYEWNDAQTDATLLTAAKDKTVAGLDWHFPSQAECAQCHTAEKDFVLGAEWSQLNHDFLYENIPESTNVVANQVDTLDGVGILSGPVSIGFVNLRLVELDDTSATLEQRAKSYLHSNCSQCHLPGGVGGQMDLRYQTEFAAMNMCNAEPLDDLSIADAKLLVPGDVAKSLIAQRMLRLGGARMPPLASSVVDVAAVAVIEEWINSIAACP